ncbi:MAG TPA: phosphatase PAP2 family protein [Moraxellaceae bacterium]
MLAKLFPSSALRDDGFSAQALCILPLLILMAWGAEASGLDAWLENRYFDAGLQAFPLRNSLLFSAVLHDGLRIAVVAMLLLLLLVLLLAQLLPATLGRYLPPFWQQPRLLPYLAAVFATGPALVGLLKQATTRSCPWSLLQYGGTLPYGGQPFFSLASAGHCFPGAHATTGFVLFAFVPLLPASRRWWMALLVFAFGMAAGWVQMLRGAHFLSHNLWSAVLGWSVMWLAWRLLQPGLLPVQQLQWQDGSEEQAT